MQRNTIRLIIGLMSFALIGLIVLQFQWVNATIWANRDRFAYNVRDAIQQVANRLEQQEAAFVASKLQPLTLAISTDSTGNIQSVHSERVNAPRQLAISTDSAGNTFWSEIKRFRMFHIIGKSGQDADQGSAYELEEETTIHKVGKARRIDSSMAGNIPPSIDPRLELGHITIRGEAASRRKLDSSWTPSTQTPMDHLARRTLPPGTATLYGIEEDPAVGSRKGTFAQEDSMDPRPNISKDVMMKFVKKSDMVWSVFNDFIHGRPQLEDRLDYAQLDSLIAEEFALRGIRVPYHFAVLNTLDDTILYSNDWKSYYQLRQSPYRTQLYPTDILLSHHALLVSFPEEDSLILQDIWWLLLLSVGFIALVIGCCLFAVMTIIRQKKISDITHDFISNLTHELKTPISTVSLATEALMDPDMQARPAQLSRYVGIIREENRRLAEQVEKVLQIARLERSDFKLSLASVNLHDLIEEAVAHFHLPVESRNGQIHLHLEAGSPMISADAAHLSNILNNLLDNAIKYSPQLLEITVRTTANEKGIKLLISDKGIGIPKDMQDKVFDKFFRVPTGNVHDVKGFGLGLSYVRTMVEAHEGTVSLRSEPGKGTTFIVFLPYAQEG